MVRQKSSTKGDTPSRADRPSEKTSREVSRVDLPYVFKRCDCVFWYVHLTPINSGSPLHPHHLLTTLTITSTSTSTSTTQLHFTPAIPSILLSSLIIIFIITSSSPPLILVSLSTHLGSHSAAAHPSIRPLNSSNHLIFLRPPLFGPSHFHMALDGRERPGMPPCAIPHRPFPRGSTSAAALVPP